MKKFFLTLVFLFLVNQLVFAENIRDVDNDLLFSDGTTIKVFYLNAGGQRVNFNENNSLGFENRLTQIDNRRVKWNLFFNRATFPAMDAIKIELGSAVAEPNYVFRIRGHRIDFSDAVDAGFFVDYERKNGIVTVTISNFTGRGNEILIDPLITLQATDTSFSNYGNVIARDSIGNIWIVQEALTSSSNTDIYIHKSTDGGTSFSTFNLTNTTDFNESLPHIDVNSTNGLIIVYNKLFETGATSEVFVTTCSTGGCDASAEFLSDINVSQCGASVRCANNNLDVDVNNYSHVTYGKDDTNLVYRQNTGYVGTVGNWGSEEININVGVTSILNRVATGISIGKSGGKKLAWVNANGAQVIVVDYNGTSWQGPLTIQYSGVSTAPSVFSGYDNKYYVSYARNFPPFLTVLTQCSIDTNCSNSANWTSDINVSTNADNSFVSIMQSSDLNLHILASASYSSADANIHHYVRLQNGTITSTQDANLLFNDSNRTYNPLLRNRDYYGSVNPTVGPSTNLFLDYVFLTTSSSTGNPSTQIFDFNQLQDINGITANFSVTPPSPIILDTETGITNISVDFNSTIILNNVTDVNYAWFVNTINVSTDQNYSRDFNGSDTDFNISLVVQGRDTLNTFTSQIDQNILLRNLPTDLDINFSYNNFVNNADVNLGLTTTIPTNYVVWGGTNFDFNRIGQQIRFDYNSEGIKQVCAIVNFLSDINTLHCENFTATRFLIKRPLDEETNTVLTPFSVTTTTPNQTYNAQTLDFNLYTFFQTSTTLTITVDYNADYNPRSYFFSLIDSNTLIQLQPLLASASDSALVTITVIDGFTESPLPGYRINLLKEISSILTLLESEITDGSGVTIFSMIVDDTYFLKLFAPDGSLVDQNYLVASSSVYYWRVNPISVPDFNLTGATITVDFQPSQINIEVPDTNFVTFAQDINTLGTMTSSNIRIQVNDTNTIYDQNFNVDANRSQLVNLENFKTKDILRIRVIVQNNERIQVFEKVYILKYPGSSQDILGLFITLRDDELTPFGAMIFALFVSALIAFWFAIRSSFDTRAVTFILIICLGIFTFIGWVPLTPYLIFSIGGIALMVVRVL